MPTASLPTPLWRSPTAVIIAGCLIALLGFGVRSSLGLFLAPLTQEHGWTRQDFGFALAMQNLLWGIGAPVASALADRFGPARVLLVGALLYALGVAGMAISTSVWFFTLSAGLVTGLGIAFTGFGIALAAIAKVVAPSQRSLALGLGTAAGSLGQVLFSPLAQSLISSGGAYSTLMIMAALSLFIIPLAFLLPNDTSGKAMAASDQTIGEALREALAHRGYLLLTAGFFVCGFQVAFITVHYPAYVMDLGMDVKVGALALMLIGLFNIAGSFLSGMAGQRWAKRYGLSLIYFGRSVATVAMLAAPKTEATILIFAAVMGLLWLSTVPLTSGIVAQVFGVRYMATLFGVVFLSHQLGSFLGVWLGGVIYDRTGSYDGLWWLSVALGIFAAVVHLPINEAPLARLSAKTA
jgi:predicted MFS family arabinose efflux permease